jgi:CheY-like chemotaxis protein
LAETRGATILVVEDDADVRVAVVETLEVRGFRVLSAGDGPEALSVLETDPSIEPMFGDLIMPQGMSGIDLVREARSLRPDLRVMLTSGYSAQVGPQEGGGAELPLIKKPYRLAELMRRIGETLGRGSN